jgi:hypothetical protein
MQVLLRRVASARLLRAHVAPAVGALHRFTAAATTATTAAAAVPLLGGRHTSGG